MITLTYGRKVPEAGDSGTPLFDALEENIALDDGHSHDGIDSPILDPQNFVGIADTITAAGWATYAGAPIGHYRQLVTMHSGYLFNTTKIGFRTTGGAYIYPTVERVSSTQYYVYSTDNTIDFIALYGG